MTRLAVLVFCVTILSVANARHQKRSHETIAQQNVKGSGPSLVIGVMATSAAYYPKNYQQEKFVQDIIQRFIPNNVGHNFINLNQENSLKFQSSSEDDIDSSEESEMDDILSDKIAEENIQYLSGIPIEAHHDSSDEIRNENLVVDSHTYESSIPNVSGSKIDYSIPVGSSYSQQQQQVVSYHNAVQNDIDASIPLNANSEKVDNPSFIQAIYPIQQQNKFFSSVDNNEGKRLLDINFNSGINGVKDPSQNAVIEKNANNINSPHQRDVDPNILESHQANEIDDDDEDFLESYDAKKSSDNPSKEINMHSKDIIGNSNGKVYDSMIEPQNLVSFNDNSRQYDGLGNDFNNRNALSINIPMKSERDPCSVLHIIVLGRRSMCRYPNIRYQY